VNCLICKSQDFELVHSSVPDLEYNTSLPIEIFKCLGCGLFFQNPLPEIEEIEKFYPTNYRNYLSIGNSLFANLKKFRILTLAKRLLKFFDKSNRVLELGFGNGQLLLTLADLGCSNLTGIDINGAINPDLSTRGIKTYNANIENFIFNDLFFDTVIVNNVIEHFINPDLVLQKLNLIMKSQSKLLIITPNANSLERSLFGKYWAGFHAPRHTFIFNPKNIEMLLSQNGFSHITIYKESDPAQWAFSLQNFLQETFLKSQLQNGMAWYSSILAMVFLPVSAVQRLFFESESMFVVAVKD
jgi:2-polyprenyl-3-methyl-5-hydroxy-6-metoxy-1,4-benzoquinol methylase